MRATILILSALGLACMAVAQEPVNTAVHHPSALQPTVAQPAAQQPGDPRLPSVYEPFVFQPMTNLPHQVRQASARQPEVPTGPSPAIPPVRQITVSDVPDACSCATRRQ